MNDATRLELDEKRYVHQTMDGEVLIIDTVGGAYYCLRGGAAHVWPMLVAGAPLPALLASAAAAFDGPAADIAASVNDFIDHLVAEGIACRVAGPDTNGAAPLAAPSSKIPFTPLTVERYDDMRDLLTLDPVHDVTDAGWPNLPR